MVMWAASKQLTWFWLLQLSWLQTLHALQLFAPHRQLNAPYELLRNMQQIVINFHQLVEAPNVEASAGRAKKQKKPKYPLYHRWVVERFGLGNVSLNLGFTANFHVSGALR